MVRVKLHIRAVFRGFTRIDCRVNWGHIWYNSPIHNNAYKRERRLRMRTEPLILKLAKKRFQHTQLQQVHFTGEPKADKLLNDLIKHPHLFVLACLMDRQIPAEKAWSIPYKVCLELGTFNIKKLSKISLSAFQQIFKTHRLHRFITPMAKVFYNAVQDITNKYTGDASKIWSGRPSSATVICRFLEFEGCGIKIATMATNILARQFKIPFSDFYCIDISPDIHIRRVMKRMGYISDIRDIHMVIYKAREINPSFPGIIDFSCWEIGREFCHPKNPECKTCPINSECKKII